MESFSSPADFLPKASLYLLHFNLARPNSHKGDLGPCQILYHLDLGLPLDLCLLPPIFLDYRLNPKGGYDVPFQFQTPFPIDMAIRDAQN